MKNVIVTGANGFIGSSLINVLLEHGVNVVAIDISFANPRFLVNNHVVLVEGDINTDHTLAEKIPQNDYDALYHLAWRGVNGAEKASPLVQLANIEMAVHCADLAKLISCRKFLCAGTVAEEAVFSLPKLHTTSGGMLYGIAKYCSRLLLSTYCKNQGVDLIWMQYSNIFGVGNRTGNLVSYTMSELRDDNEATFGSATQLYDFVYIDDLLEAVYRLGHCDLKGDFYYIGSGQPRLLKDYLMRIGELCGKPRKICIGKRPDDGIKYDAYMFDNSPLVNDIGEYVSTSFDDGIVKTWNWFLTQK